MVSERTAELGISTISTSYDGRNAFASIDFDELDNVVAKVTQHSTTEKLLQQRYRCATATVTAIDDVITYKIGSGSLPGDTIACDYFRWAFTPRVTRWAEELSMRPNGKILHAIEPISAEIVDLSYSIYADDIERDQVFPEGACVRQVANEMHYVDELLDHNLTPIGIHQNATKKEHIPKLKGDLAGTTNQKLLSNSTAIAGRRLPSFKYLGALCHRSNSAVPEMKARINAANINWFTFVSYFVSCAPYKHRRALFISLILSTLVSGLEAKTPTESEYVMHETYCASRLRALLKGRAHTVCTGLDGGVKHKQITNRQVFKTARIAPPQVELLARRLKWYSKIANNRTEHKQLLAAAFGRMEFAEAESVAIQPPRSNWREYRLTGLEPTWALRVITDITNLARITELGLNDLADAIAINPLRLFADPWAIGLLQQTVLSISIIRASFFDTELLDHLCPDNLSHETNQTVCRQFKCPIETNGLECCRTFDSLRGLETHLRFSGQPGHGWESLLFKLVVVNQCPMCLVVFSDRQTAQNHVARSIQTLRCATPKGVYAFSRPSEPNTLMCPMSAYNTNELVMCDKRFQSLAQMQEHIREVHLPSHPIVEDDNTRQCSFRGGPWGSGGSSRTTVRYSWKRSKESFSNFRRSASAKGISPQQRNGLRRRLPRRPGLASRRPESFRRLGRRRPNRSNDGDYLRDLWEQWQRRCGQRSTDELTTRRPSEVRSRAKRHPFQSRDNRLAESPAADVPDSQDSLGADLGHWRRTAGRPGDCGNEEMPRQLLELGQGQLGSRIGTSLSAQLSRIRERSRSRPHLCEPPCTDASRLEIHDNQDECADTRIGMGERLRAQGHAWQDNDERGDHLLHGQVGPTRCSFTVLDPQEVRCASRPAACGTDRTTPPKNARQDYKLQEVNMTDFSSDPQCLFGRSADPTSLGTVGGIGLHARPNGLDLSSSATLLASDLSSSATLLASEFSSSATLLSSDVSQQSTIPYRKFKSRDAFLAQARSMVAQSVTDRYPTELLEPAPKRRRLPEMSLRDILRHSSPSNSYSKYARHV